VEKNFKRLSQESLTQNKENQTLKNFLKQLLFFCSVFNKKRVLFFVLPNSAQVAKTVKKKGKQNQTAL